ncbi:MAG: ubiquinone/menaquinone biosynthesis methyltransferase, partial [Hyphomicrobium sp.]
AGLDARITCIEGNAETLAFEASSFDAYTIAFGIRNVTHIDRALAEAYRVLKPGGRFLCLEFSEVQVPLLDRLYDFHSFEVIPRLGKLTAGAAEPYQYLVESIRKFPKQEAFAAMIRDAGFERVSYRNLTGGVAAMHSGWKI